MNRYRFNQIAMAVLGALLLIFGTRTLINIAFEEHEPEKPGIEVAGTKEGEKPGAEKPAGPDLGTLLASGDAKAGETAAAACKVCHSFDAGAPSPIGPPLHNVVGRKIASVEGFNYSPALKAKSGETWTYEHLNNWIMNPQSFAQGTIMAFPGIPDAKQRANVILFLRSKTENPPPLPEPKAAPEAPTAEAGKPAAAAGAPAAPGAEILPALAKADPKRGEADVALCKVCHSFDKGAPSPVGPNLYGVVGRKIASVEGFNYSPALKAKASEGDWTFEHLDQWLTNPQAFAAGTIMAFPGIPDLQKRADVIDFLRTKADNPMPLPAAAEAKPAEAPAAAEKPAEAPAAEKKPAEAPAPEEKPAEAPAAEEKPAEAPAAEEKPAEAPAAEEKPAEAPAAAEKPEAPAAEEKPAEAPAAEEKPAEEPATAPAEEAPAAAPQPAANADFSEPSISTQPQPVVPSEEAEAPAPAAAEAPAEAPQPAANGDFSEPSTSTQPQPVVPSEEAEAPAPAAAEAPATEAAPADFAEPSTSTQPQPAYPDGAPE
jgi:cytochrome c